jgi:hypothetical protein
MTTEELAIQLQQHLSHRFRGLLVHVSDNGVVLRGRVCTYYAKQVAQHIVMRLTDLPILANEIEVRLIN